MRCEIVHYSEGYLADLNHSRLFCSYRSLHCEGIFHIWFVSSLSKCEKEGKLFCISDLEM